MSSRSRVNPLLAKPYEFPEFWDYSPEVGAYHRQSGREPKRKPAQRDAGVAQRDYRLAKFRATGERSYLYGMVRVHKAQPATKE